MIFEHFSTCFSKIFKEMGEERIFKRFYSSESIVCSPKRLRSIYITMLKPLQSLLVKIKHTIITSLNFKSIFFRKSSSFMDNPGSYEALLNYREFCLQLYKESSAFARNLNCMKFNCPRHLITETRNFLVKTFNSFLDFAPTRDDEIIDLLWRNMTISKVIAFVSCGILGIYVWTFSFVAWVWFYLSYHLTLNFLAK